jgi:putative oxidoreductase
MESTLARLGPVSHLAFRAMTGLLFACHGAQKLFGMFGGFPPGSGGRVELLSQFGAAGIIELAGGLLVALGVRARIAAFICSGEMAVAYFQVHFSKGLLPIQNGGELAVLYCFAFLVLACLGPGPFTLERGGK